MASLKNSKPKIFDIYISLQNYGENERELKKKKNYIAIIKIKRTKGKNLEPKF